MDGTTILTLAILALIVIVVAFRYRHSIRVGLRGPLNTSLDINAENRASGDSGKSGGSSSPGDISASGERSVATGSADGATITTGDQTSKGS